MKITDIESVLKVVELACFIIIVLKSFINLLCHSQILLFIFAYHHIIFCNKIYFIRVKY